MGPWKLDENPSKYCDYNWYSDELPTRKFYLFLAEIGRRLRHLMTDPGPIAMIDLCERCADGHISESDLCELAYGHRPTAGPGGSYASNAADDVYWWVTDRYKVAAECVDEAVDAFAYLAAVEDELLPSQPDPSQIAAVRGHPVFASVLERTELEWGALVRDIYGPDPFRPTSLDPAWRSDTAVSLARGMYESRDFAAMPILADAMQDAGCESDNVLAHCRDPHGVHVRGCWVVDLVLGKA